MRASEVARVALFILLLGAGVLFAGCATGSMSVSPREVNVHSEEDYWREWWLVKLLADQEDFAKFATAQEPDSARTLAAQPAQQSWLDDWWEARDPDWTTPTNEWRRYIDSLAAIADFSYYRSGKVDADHAPWDIRGRYFIRLGPPDEIDRAAKVRRFNPQDNERTARMQLEQFGVVTADVAEEAAAETDAFVWVWYPRVKRNDKPIRVQFQLNSALEWEAVSEVVEGAGLLGGIHLDDLANGEDMIARATLGPEPEYYSDNRDPIPVVLRGTRFHQQYDTTDLWLSYAIPLNEISLNRDAGKIKTVFTVRQERSLYPEDSVKQMMQPLRSSRLLGFTATGNGDDNVAMQVERFSLPSGNYHVGFRIDDLNDSTRGISGKLGVTIVPFARPDSQEIVSDAMLLASAPLPETAGGGRFTRYIAGERLRLQPYPSHVFTRDQDSLRVYHEAYNLVKAKDSSRVMVRYLLYKDNRGRAKDAVLLGEFPKHGERSELSFYGAFSLADIHKGEYYLFIETIDLNDPDNLRLTERRLTAIDFKIQ